MVRIGWVFGTMTLGLAMLLTPGCEQPAPVVPTAPPPAPPVGDLQTQARQIVAAGLADASPQIRANAVEVVATTGDLSLVPRMQRLLSDETVPVRFLATLALGDLARVVGETDVTRQLADPDTNVRIAACYVMVRRGHPEYYREICEEVASDDQTVRANAALLLGKSGRQEGLRYLWWTLRRKDSADKVVLQAAESIAMLGDHSIYPKLLAQLISGYADDRVIGIRAMGALGTDEAKNRLVTMLEDKVPEVRLAAAEQLGKLGETMGEPVVREIFEKRMLAGIDIQSQERLKVFAALAIGEVGTEPLAKYLPPLLQDPSPTVRLAAAKAVLRRARVSLATPPAAGFPPL